MTYDYLIVGAGFFGSVFARLATDAGKKCLVIDSRHHIGGNAYTEKHGNIDVHCYGPHIFHTNDDRIWEFVNKFTKFNNFVLNVKAFRHGRMYSLPFNMNTFHEIWGCTTPEQAKKIIDSQKFQDTPTNLEEQALSQVGKEIYELLIKEYTEKQWQTEAKNLPASIIKRLPVRYTYDNNYFNDKYQGIPVDGYTAMFEKMLDGIEVRLNENYFEKRDEWNAIADKIVFTGKIDEFFNYEFGELQYRCLEFTHQIKDTENWQGTAIVNYPDSRCSWTRIVEHKHFTGVDSKETVITYEVPVAYSRDKTPYYPINDDINTEIYKKYREKADSLNKFIFGGRLANYHYYDMHQVIGAAMKAFKNEKT